MTPGLGAETAERVEPGAAPAVLVPYLPRLVIDWLASRPADLYREVAGSVAFVDISGFTKLSERLAKRGKVGAEDLTETIGSCFARLLAIAYANGGGLLKFGGDALLLLFSGDGHEQRSCAAAIGMRRALRDIGRLEVAGRTIQLRMSVGVHSGLFHFFLVGGSHREFIVTGPAASATVQMEATAEAGEIVVSTDTAAALRPAQLGRPKGPGWLLRRATAATTDGWEVPPASDGLDVAGCLPVLIRRSLLAGGHRTAEHRRVTVTFVHFDGTDELISEHGPAEAARRLDGLVRAVQDAVDRQGIAFLGSDIDRDGGKIILTAGAPVATGDDERRMLVALRDVFDAGVELPLRAGVNRGDVFAGDIGPPYRQTFTVMGDTVNLAARLMAKAIPGEIIAAKGVIERAGRLFAATPLEPFLVKGKAKPIQAFAVGGPVQARRPESAVGGPLVGRRRELAALLEAVADARSGRGKLVELVGDPGVGKSRLVAEMRQQTPEVVHLSVGCEAYASSIPYFALRSLVRDLLGLDRSHGEPAGATGLREAVTAVDETLLPWVPLLGPLVGIAVPETPETAQLEERFRRPRLAELLRTLLGKVLDQPTVLSIDDSHWMDEASAELVELLAAGVTERPWVLCVTRRDEQSGFVAAGPEALSLALGPLDAEDSARLLRIATDDAPLPPHQLEALVERAGGNPLFLHELVHAVRSTDGLLSLPDSIEALISSRIDQLDQPDRTLLRRASVLGRSFPRSLLAAVVDAVPGDDDPVWGRLAGFLATDSSGRLHFEHALARDSAYEALSYRLRWELHARVGDALRASVGDDPAEQAALLSLHYFHAQRYREAWQYGVVAATAAQAVYANIEAAELYERSVAAATHLPEVAGAELGGVYEALGDVRNRVGGYAGAEVAYRRARRLLAGDPVADARLVLKLAWVQGWLDRYSIALRWITRGLRTLEGTQSIEASRQRSQLLAWYGRFCQEQGRHSRAIKWCQEAAEAAEASGDKDALAHALRVMDWAEMDLGRLGEPVNLERALALYTELGDLPGQASVLNMLGGFAYWRGDWQAALDLYARARDTLLRTGNTVMRAFCTNNIAEIALDQGRLEEAGELFTEASRVWQAAGYRSGVAALRCHMARVLSRTGRYEEAVSLLQSAAAELKEIGAGVDVLEATSRLAECHLTNGRPPEALAAADEALEQARLLGGVSAQTPLLHRTRGMALALLGDPLGAAAALEDSLALARTRRADFEVALTLRAMGELRDLEAPGTTEAAQLRGQSQRILDRLGVVAVPGLARPQKNLGSAPGRRMVSTMSPAEAPLVRHDSRH